MISKDKKPILFRNYFSFAALASPIKWHLILGVILACIAAIGNFGLLFLSGWLLASAAVAGLGGTAIAKAFNIILPAAGVRFFAMLRIVARYLERVITHDGALRLTSLLRVNIFKHLIPLAPAGLINQRGGDILGRFITDTDLVSAYYTDVIIPFARAFICTIIFVFTFIWFSSFSALALTVGLFISCCVIPVCVYYLSYHHIQKTINYKNTLQTNFTEILQNLGEMLVLGIAPARMSDIQQTQYISDRNKWILDAIESAGRGINTIIMMLCILITLIQNVHEYHQGILTGPEIPMLILGTLAAFDVTFSLPLASQAAAKAYLSEQRLDDACKPTDFVSNTSSLSCSQPYDLYLDNVSFHYPNNPMKVFNQASLTIKQGEHIALVGPSGIGKSSLINLLFSFYPLSEGKITFGGVDTRKISTQDLSSIISVVTQDFHLFSGTIKENLLLANPQSTPTEIEEALRISQLYDFVSGLAEGLNTRIGNEGIRLSGGQAKRLSIAQGLIRKTPWLILDEPTEGLDPQTEYALMTALLKARPETTIIVITHRDAILPLMSRIITMENGDFL
ncbi:thiol reductant ABC exporter subunit CydC [Commensalibacter oyaizuii]|uniref:Thiol reductant ABC exporter subunit CydC n=1 Tax=Commensalibacter oyaizuii TaxID=3043873 RepID=A0ABT6Q343_9PROT|nr:thiol reductant ABC exporter subunit CydC [Commensalibacter sp. TBRC 16381]MDI2091531.1 thiol reductant ABC exporter subunit CydC [Commensalibacter sp. TBRC 16381]